jgi:serine/threonine protein kinase
MHVPHTEIIAILEEREIFRAVLPPGDYLIGREGDVPIKIEAPKVSRKHGQLSLSYFDWVIEDLGSSNGTWVGGKRITAATMIFPQQEVRLGNVQLRLRRIAAQGDETEEIAPQTAAVLRFLPEHLRDQRKYEVKAMIAMGGMGAILEAEDKATRRAVAMKVLLNANTPEDIARFVEEAQVTAQLEHPNIIPIYELGVNELDKPFYTMKLMRGESLQHVFAGLARGDAGALERYPLGELLLIFQKICDAISYAHSKGVVHRDLKPENVMLGSYGEAVVMDWGLAKTLGHSAHEPSANSTVHTMVQSVRREEGGEFMTMVGRAIGTPQFMSPEQAVGQSHEVDARADVYALGAMLYEMLTLHPPFEGEDTMAIFEQVIAGQIRPPAEVIGSRPMPHLPDGKLPLRLAAIAMKALARQREDRYATVRELQAEVQSYQSGEERSGLKFGLENWFRAKKPGQK